MLDDHQLEEYFQEHGLLAQARQYIRQTRNDPSRLVGVGAQSNVISSFPSTKAGALIQTESRTAEHRQALEHEYSKSVIEFWDQPPAIGVVRTSAKGKPLSGHHIPDFVVLDTTGPYVEEVKTAEEIERLLQTKPADWVRVDSGVTFAPALAAFSRIGLSYVVTSAANTNAIRADNLKLLLQSRKAPPYVNDGLRAAVQQALSKQAWLNLKALAKKTQLTDLTPLLQMIDEGFLHAALSEELLAQPDSTWVARSPEILAFRIECNASDYGYVAPGGEEISASSVDLPAGKAAARAVANMARLDAGEKSRSVRRWNRKMQQGLHDGMQINIFLATLPNWRQCGNRTPRLCKEQRQCLEDFYKRHYATETRLKITAAYKLYKNIANEVHPLVPAASRRTFTKLIALKDASRTARGRGGRRAANAAAAPTPVEARQILATRPFQLAVIDHYETDIYCVLASRDGQHDTARPWLTVLVDVANDYVYAFWLSFRPPSRRACAMAIRLCVRKHGRLPEEILFDGGPEFESVYFYTLLAHCGVGPVRRPPEHPRYGARGERFFGEFRNQWLNYRPGNLVNLKEARGASRSHASQNGAMLTIEQLLTELLAFCDWRNANKVGLGVLSPAEHVAEGLRTFSCSGVVVVDDAAFRIASAVDVTDYALDPARGLHIGELHYWHPELRKLAAVGRVEFVRDEPEDPYCVYAKVRSKWVTCLATGAQAFAALDPVRRLTEAIRIHDGRKARAAAKDDAEQRLITRMRELDAKWTADAAIAAAQASTKVPTPPDDAVFKRARTTTIKSLKSTKWK